MLLTPSRSACRSSSPGLAPRLRAARVVTPERARAARLDTAMGVRRQSLDAAERDAELARIATLAHRLYLSIEDGPGSWWMSRTGPAWGSCSIARSPTGSKWKPCSCRTVAGDPVGATEASGASSPSRRPPQRPAGIRGLALRHRAALRRGLPCATPPSAAATSGAPRGLPAGAGRHGGGSLAPPPILSAALPWWDRPRLGRGAERRAGRVAHRVRRGRSHGLRRSGRPAGRRVRRRDPATPRRRAPLAEPAARARVRIGSRHSSRRTWRRSGESSARSLPDPGRVLISRHGDLRQRPGVQRLLSPSSRAAVDTAGNAGGSLPGGGAGGRHQPLRRVRLQGPAGRGGRARGDSRAVTHRPCVPVGRLVPGRVHELPPVRLERAP